MFWLQEQCPKSFSRRICVVKCDTHTTLVWLEWGVYGLLNIESHYLKSPSRMEDLDQYELTLLRYNWDLQQDNTRQISWWKLRVPGKTTEKKRNQEKIRHIIYHYRVFEYKSGMCVLIFPVHSVLHTDTLSLHMAQWTFVNFQMYSLDYKISEILLHEWYKL